jgi:hypothetical protein
MGRVKIAFAIELAVLGALALLMVLPACRKEGVPLDRNKAPETYLTSSPTETTSTDYRVHMYWHGKDEDGVVRKYIWYVSDTVMTLDPDRNPDAEGLDWNPSERIADYLSGRFTTKTDTVIIFKGYDEKKGAEINRQAFHIAAVDDGGKIDPSPARLQFLARVRGVPAVKFWTNFGGGDVPYISGSLDTISMFLPFAIKFNATTVNNVITGYRWSYGGSVYPDYNSDGNPDWLIPANQAEVVSVELQNSGAASLPSGLFAFKAIARDEAGALSKSDLITGEGVCQIVLNHDPDTRLDPACQIFFTPRSSGVLESLTVNLIDQNPDTLPDSSLVRMFYWGWDDPKDRAHLQYNPPRPIRFQFAYNRWAIDEDGLRVANKMSPWYPLKYPEDTNPNAGVSDPYRDRDSTTMRVATFQYLFYVRSFDEQRRTDGTPAVVSFMGNFPPTVDSIRTGFWDLPVYPPSYRTYHPTMNDTIIVGWDGLPTEVRGDTLGPYEIKLVGTSPNVTQKRSFKFVIRAGGHDDRRDPLGSGIKGWRYRVADPDEDLTYSREGEWQFNKPLNIFEQECSFSIIIPYPDSPGARDHVLDSLLSNPPAFLGAQTIDVSGMDDRDTENFFEGIRGISPEFDENGNLKPGQNNWIVNDYSLTNYARRDTKHIHLYLKFVK